MNQKKRRNKTHYLFLESTIALELDYDRNWFVARDTNFKPLFSGNISSFEAQILKLFKGYHD